MHQTAAAVPPARSPDIWPPDDSEERVMGTDLHQKTILNLRLGINEIAAALAAPGQPVPWQALSQTLLLGCERPDGSRYRTLPDVFVYSRPIDERRSSVSLSRDGPPVLVVEVLSEWTCDSDLDLVRGKGYSYARAGIAEYLVLDPAGEFLAERGRAWRLQGGQYQEWPAAEDGRWYSECIAVAFGLEGTLATVYTRDGRRVLREGEMLRHLERQEAELAELRRLVEQLRQQSS